MKPIRERWIAAGASPRDGATSEDLKRFETKYGVTLPSDVASFYRGVNGMPPNHMDDRMIRWWPVEEVQPATSVGHDELQYADFFVFADWSLDAHLYAINLTPGEGRGAVLIPREGAPIPVAASFSEFLDLYVRRSGRLLGGADDVRDDAGDHFLSMPPRRVLETPWALGVWITWGMGPGLALAAFVAGRVFSGGDPEPGHGFALAVFLVPMHGMSILFTVGMLLSRGRFRQLPEFWLLAAYWLPMGVMFTKLFNLRSSDRIPPESLLQACVLTAIGLAAAVPLVSAVRLAARRARSKRAL